MIHNDHAQSKKTKKMPALKLQFLPIQILHEEGYFPKLTVNNVARCVNQLLCLIKASY